MTHPLSKALRELGEKLDGEGAVTLDEKADMDEAAAPDLLEAASWARDILVQLKDAGHSVEIELTACERAIAKAEGRE